MPLRFCACQRFEYRPVNRVGLLDDALGSRLQNRKITEVADSRRGESSHRAESVAVSAVNNLTISYDTRHANDAGGVGDGHWSVRSRMRGPAASLHAACAHV